MKLGDVVASVTKAVGIEPCDACSQRQEQLNKLGDNLARMFTQDDLPCRCGRKRKPGSAVCSNCARRGLQ